jgi:hypothetical protein
MIGFEGLLDRALTAARSRVAKSSRDTTAFPRRWPHRFVATAISLETSRVNSGLRYVTRQFPHVRKIVLFAQH